jgi:hypothetical protein
MIELETPGFEAAKMEAHTTMLKAMNVIDMSQTYL